MPSPHSKAAIRKLALNFAPIPDWNVWESAGVMMIVGAPGGHGNRHTVVGTVDISRKARHGQADKT